MRADAERERDQVLNNRQGDQAGAETQVAEPLYSQGEHLPEGEGGADGKGTGSLGKSLRQVQKGC